MLSFRERMQDLIKLERCSNFLQIFTFLNMPALNYKTQSAYLIGILLHFKLLSCPALASEGCHFMRKMWDRELNHTYLVPDTLQS